ncbi:MAG TPA: hypothetical protein VNC61_09770 [Acidimicrobiales bacterium]|nr:hypothetical protein [Acidimicrobiales bacterium]
MSGGGPGRPGHVGLPPGAGPGGPGRDDLAGARGGRLATSIPGPGIHRRPRWVVEWLVVLAVAVGLALGVRAFVAET